MIRPDQLAASCLTGLGLWALAFGHIGLGLAAALVGAAWLWGNADDG